jgi:MFS transporter, FHS family, glucose/mannose:H+ symporter
VTSPDATERSRTTLVAVGLAFGLLGATVAVHGAAVPLLRERFAISTATAGLVLPVHAAAAILGTLAWGVFDRLDCHRAGLRAGGVLVPLGAVAIAVAPDLGLLLGAAAVLGAGLGVLVTGGNAITSRDRAAGAVRRLNVVHAMFGVGAISGPTLLSVLGFRTTLLVVAAGGAAALGGLARPPAAVRRTTVRDPDRDARRADRRVLLAFLSVFGLYIGMELGVANWMAAHLADRGWSAPAAARWTSGYFVAFTVGRLLTARFASDADPARVVGWALTAGAAAATLAAVPVLTPVAYVLVGLAISPVFPTTMVWLGRRLPDVPDAPTAAMFAGNVGAVALPVAIGAVIEALGTGWVPGAVAVLGVTATTVALVLARSGRPTGAAGTSPAPRG